MAVDTKKPAPPPYVSFSSFRTFLKGLGKTTVPDRIDPTVMSKFSGSVRYALLPALQWLDLIDKDGAPQPSMYQLAEASEEEFGPRLKQVLKERYSFLFSDGLDLKKATSGQVSEAFKAQGAQGSTITKAMQFFLVAAKAAGIEVSPHVKPPTPPRVSKKKTGKARTDVEESTKEIAEDDPSKPPEGMEAIHVSVHGQSDWTIWVPAGLNYKQWSHGLKVAMFNLENYRQPEG